jgi:hypothetical protein
VLSATAGLGFPTGAGRILAAGRDGIELSDIPDELNTIDHCASAEDA